MKKLIVLYILMGICWQINAQTAQQWYVKGNNAYQLKQYDLAIDCYRTALVKNGAQFELYFNLGNAYYQQQNIAKSIYYFEKSLRLAPKNTAAVNNLKLANQLKESQLPKLPNSFSDLIYDSLQWLSIDTWAILNLSWLLVVVVLSFLFFKETHRIKKRKLLFGVASVAVFFILNSLLLVFYQNQQNQKYAIVFSKKTKMQESPSVYVKTIRTIPEGNKVKIIDQAGSWYGVVLDNGEQGWLLKKEVEII